jgi:hypothetical protein
MSRSESTLEIGGGVIVKKGVLDPDFDADLSGLQGRLTSIEEVENEEFVDIEWDSISLRSMSPDMIIKCEEEGLDWRQMRLYIHEIEPANLRDTSADVKAVVNELETKYMWISQGKEGRRIHSILSGIHPSDEMGALERWEKYLETEIKFPIEAEIYESQRYILLSTGDSVIIERIELVDDSYGIIVRIRHKRRKFDIPLCDLDATENDPGAHQIISDYRVWFANR